MVIEKVESRVLVDGQPLLISATLHKWHLADCDAPWAGYVVETRAQFIQRGGHVGRPRPGTKRYEAMTRASRAMDALDVVAHDTMLQAWRAFDEALADLTGRDICERCHTPLTDGESRFTEQRLASEVLCRRCYRGEAVA